MVKMADDGEVVYALIANIPSFYHSADLRNYFSQFIESGGFSCFHFRHRPEGAAAETRSDGGGREERRDRSTKTLCCVVRLRRDQLKKLVKMYHRRHWLDRKGEPTAALCFISKLKVNRTTQESKPKFQTRGELKKIPFDREAFTYNDLISLPEMNPPSIMPRGNVGTPTQHFLQLIQKCQLPPKVISRLGLVFPKTRSKRRYGNVGLDYGGELHEDSSEQFSEILSAKGNEILPEGSNLESSNKNKHNGNIKATSGEKDGTNGEEDAKSEDDVDECEEWERHEALHDDPSNQERNKERLYEEELEIVWEKGGPGIVWYTDAQFWDQQDGDEEEKDVDDWDIDMSEYYEPGSGDKDARDFVQMRKEMRMAQCLDSDEESDAKIGKFELHTKGIGRKVMVKQGWHDGQGLGSSVHGMADALDGDGQKPNDKRGFGYRGEKLSSKFSVLPANRKRTVNDSVYRVWSVYDAPETKNSEETLLRRQEPHCLKYRDGIRFVKSASDPKDSRTSVS